MNIFLRELSRQYAHDYILLVLDNAAWHTTKTLEVPPNIELFPSLAYTPELNPIEMIWDEIREKGFRNEAFQTLSKVEDRLCDTFKSQCSILSASLLSLLGTGLIQHFVLEISVTGVTAQSVCAGYRLHKPTGVCKERAVATV